MKLWVALAGLKPNPTCKNFRRFGNGKGAYVHIVAWAHSVDAFTDHLKSQVEELDCILYDLDDIGELDSRIASGDFPDEFLDLRERAKKEPRDTVFGHFHIWLNEEAN